MGRNVTRRAVLVVALCALFPALMPEARAETAADRIAALLAPMQRYSAAFEQTVRGAQHEVKESSHGYVHVERPRCFKWVVESPYQQEIVTRGERLFIYDPDLAQVQVRTLDRALDGTPALVLTGTAQQIAEQFDVTEAAADGNRTFALVPRGAGALYTRFTMTFAREALTGIDIFDSLGQVTEVRFHDANPRPDFPKDEFDFAIPAGADVIGNGAEPRS